MYGWSKIIALNTIYIDSGISVISTQIFSSPVLPSLTLFFIVKIMQNLYLNNMLNAVLDKFWKSLLVLLFFLKVDNPNFNKNVIGTEIQCNSQTLLNDNLGSKILSHCRLCVCLTSARGPH